ncbi:contractile injection system protein, VgrG/Pvc8 family [Burkholderia thailandensis]|uniref:contractile injection system protein, VgrG/Pvc8 family n=1 Tax=Burkholderia thailandensis TaxID=57975 RepID=UPI0021B40B8E|nr:contractile injection system protein, VgrG/Pvc8 family [Burkholderia thailandensis]
MAGRHSIRGLSFQLTALAENPSLPLAQLIGAPILIEWQAQEGATRAGRSTHVIAAELVGYNAASHACGSSSSRGSRCCGSVDSYNYLNASVVEISEQVFRRYARGAIAPAWRWALADAAKYPKRSLTAQAGESDFDFLERLWAEEASSTGSSTKATRVRRASASTRSCSPIRISASRRRTRARRFHQTSDDDPQGCIQHFMHARRCGSQRRARELGSPQPVDAADGRARTAGRPARTATSPARTHTRLARSETGARSSNSMRSACRAAERSRGTRRDLRPGLRFAIAHHPTLGASDAFICLRVEHSARANVDATVRSAIEQRLGAIASIPMPRRRRMVRERAECGARRRHASRRIADAGRRCLSQSLRRVARRAGVSAARRVRPWRAHAPGRRDAGAQTAIVVGAGDPFTPTGITGFGFSITRSAAGMPRAAKIIRMRRMRRRTEAPARGRAC